MNGIDIFIGVLIVFGLFRGFQKGLILELASVLALIFGLIGAFTFSDLTKVYLLGWLKWEEEYLQIASFILTFLGIVICITLIGKLLTKFMQAIALGGVNRIFGSVFGGLKMLLIVILLMLVFKAINTGTDWFEKEQLHKSKSYAFLDNQLINYLPNLIDYAKENEIISDEIEVILK